MAVSYQTNWDTCQYLDYPSFSLPDLMDMELQQALSLDHYNFPSIDAIFDTNFDNHNNNQHSYLYPCQTSNESKPFMCDTSLVDFSTHVENLPCLSSSDAFVDFSTHVENLPSLTSSEALVDFSTHVENLPCLSSSDAFVDFSTDPEKLSCLYDNHASFSTNVRKRPCPSGGFVDFSTHAEKVPRLSGGFVDFSTHAEKVPRFSDGPIDFSTHVEKLAYDGFVDFSTGVQCPPVFSIGSGGALSAQSVAARQRRRKITERTQELGKLVPGGNKMNTAEMFGAAYDYIKYLQAQVGILQLLDSTQGNEDGQVLHSEDLEKLASSSKVQEKLYSQRKCLVPKHLIQSLANDEELKNSNPAIAKEIQQLIQKSG